MALTGTDRGTGTNAVSGLTFTLSPASNFTAGTMAVLCLSVDNSRSGGVYFTTFTITDTLGNTWTRRISPLYDPGPANAGVAGAMFTTPQNGGTLQTGTIITVTFDTACPCKVWTLMQITGSIGTPTFKAQGVGTGSATNAPTVTSGSIKIGQMIIGGVFNEYGTAQTPTGDSDTTNGSWSTMQTAEIGTTTAGQTIITQRKVVTATGTQTYNPILGTSSDCIAAWISIGEDITVSTGLGTLILDGFATIVSITNNVLVTIGLGILLLTGFASTIALSDNKIAQTDLGQLDLVGFIPIVITSDNKIINAGAGELNLNGFTSVITVSNNQFIQAQTGQVDLIGFIPTVNIEAVGVTIETNIGELAVLGFVPTVTGTVVSGGILKRRSGTEWKQINILIVYKNT